MGSSWSDLRRLIQTLGLELQAFCLNDGLETKGKEYFSAAEEALRVQFEEIIDKQLELDPDWQIVFNLWLRGETEAELKSLVEIGLARIDEEIKEDPSRWWVSKVRQRVLLALSIRQLIDCMAHPENLRDANSTDLFDQSQWAWARFRIKDGKVDFHLSVLIAILEGIPVERVRECPICLKYFWAGRINMRCCSTRHATALRMREYRKSDKAV